MKEKLRITFSGIAKKYLVLVVLITILFNCNPNREFLSNELQDQMARKRIIQESDNREEFDITYVKPQLNRTKTYYWFRSGKIHKTVGTYEGMLVDNSYIRFNENTGLKEKGSYKNGLRTGKWFTYYDNGLVKSRRNYVDGRQHGVYTEYDSLGRESLRGKFLAGRKHGKWLYTKDNNIHYYNRGKDVSYDSLRLQIPFYKRWFLKKRDSLNAANPKKINNKKATNTKAKRTVKPLSKKDSIAPKEKDGFFKRVFGGLFKKKEKKKENDKS